MANESVEYYVDAIQTQETHKRLKLADSIHVFVKSPNTSAADAGLLVDGLMTWVNNSNFKVSTQGLELLGIIANRMGPSFKPHINSVLSNIVDRLGDSKQVVRDQALNVLFKFMDPVSKPQHIFDLLFQYFNHKNWRVREVLMLCLTQAINRFDPSSIQINKFTPCLVKLLSDPTGQVRDTAMSSLVEIYRHVGERVRVDLSKRNIPESKLNNIIMRFDQIKKSGEMIEHSETDGPPASTEKKKAKGISVRRSTSFSAGDKKKHDRTTSSSGGSGAVVETDFVAAWEEVQDAKLFSMREFPNELERVNEILSNGNNPWEKRVDALRMLRSLVKISGNVDNLPKMMKELECALRTSVKDLRSSIVREACLTLSYLSSRMENKFDYLAECMFPPLIALIPNSVKIMSTSAHAAIRLIIKHTSSSRLIPLLVSNLLTAKSKDIRRRCAEYIGLLLDLWDSSVLKSHVALLEEAIRKGISDADSETRAAVRRSYWHFADHYPTRAEILMQNFDASKQKLLQSDKNLINTGTPTASHGRVKKTPKPVRSISNNSDSANKVRLQPSRGAAMGPPLAAPPMQRSTSQLDYKSRTPKMTPRQKSCDDFKRNNARTAMREGRPRYQPMRSAASQPSSRNSSPKRVAMPLFSRERSEDFMKSYSPQKTRIPTPHKTTSRTQSRSNSRQSSREPSPIRSTQGHYDMRGRNGAQSAGSGYVTEDALWDALRTKGNRKNSMNGQNSDESDTSSLSSHHANRNVTQEYDDILVLLQQDSTNAKRDGLASLQAYLHGLNSLLPEDVLRIKETFNKYFAEPNNKIYSSFLDVLSDFIVQYKNDLRDWLFVLLTRLLHRISSDMLSSLQTKVARVLDIVRDSYPYDHQFHIITKYITDNTQTPTLRVKVSLLEYLRGLIALMDASDFVNTAPIRLSISRIITWITEPKSLDVRKEASLVIIALFQLNSPEFSSMLSLLPNSIQEGATRVIKMHLQQASSSARDQHSSSSYESDCNNSVYTPTRRTNSDSSVFRSVSPMKKGSTSRDDYSTNFTSRLPGRPDTYEGADAFDSPSSKIPVRKLSYDEHPPTTPYGYGTHYTDNSSPMWLSKETSYNPKPYEDGLLDGRCSGNSSFGEVNRVADGAEQPEQSAEIQSSNSVNLIHQIFAVLSGPQNTHDSDDIKNALLELLKLVRSGNKQLSNKLKSLVPVVLHLLQHKESTIRCLAARTTREIASSQPGSYRCDLRAFLLPLLETEADSQKEVAKTAEECCTIVTQILPGSEILPVIIPLCGSAPFPVNLSAIRMLDTLAGTCDISDIRKNLDSIVGNLLAAYDHKESSVRKAAVFCLVSVHNIAGAEAVIPYFKDLAGSKMKLLNLYIRRSQSANV